jgi:hypothetical protein
VYEKHKVLSMDKLIKINSPGHDYYDLYYTQSGILAAVYLDFDKNIDRCDLYRKDGNSYRLLKSEVSLPDAYEQTILSPVSIRDNDTVYHEEQVTNKNRVFTKIIRVFKTNKVVFPEKSFSVFWPNVYNDNIIFSSEVNGIYKIARSDNWFSNLSFFSIDNNMRHLYAPYYWDSGKLLFLYALEKNPDKIKKNYIFKMYVLSNFNTNNYYYSIVGMTKKMDIKPFKVSGNSDGTIFVFQKYFNRDFKRVTNTGMAGNSDGDKKHLRYFENSIFAAESGDVIFKKGKLPLKYENIITLDNFISIYSFVFHPNDPLSLMVVGKDKQSLKTEVFIVKFKYGLNLLFNLTENGILIIILTAFLLIFIVFPMGRRS